MKHVDLVWMYWLQHQNTTSAHNLITNSVEFCLHKSWDRLVNFYWPSSIDYICIAFRSNGMLFVSFVWYTLLLSFQFNPEHVDGLFLLATIFANDSSNFEAAENTFREVIRLNPRHFEAQRDLCALLVKQSKQQEAQICLTNLNRNISNDSGVRQTSDVAAAD